MASRTPKKVKNLVAGLQKIENITKNLFLGDFFIVSSQKYNPFTLSSDHF